MKHEISCGDQCFYCLFFTFTAYFYLYKHYKPYFYCIQCMFVNEFMPTLFTSSWTITDKAEQTTVTHMFSHLLGLLWSYDFSWSSPLVHSKWWNHTICFQGNMLTTDKHSSNCGGNTFFPFQAAVCVFVRQEPPDHCERGAALKGPFFSCYTTGGHCSVCLHILGSLSANTFATDIKRQMTSQTKFYLHVAWLL